MNIYKLLSEGGGYSLPYLLHIYNDVIDVRVINDNKPLTFQNKSYAASAFDYKPNEDGSASLEIELVDTTQIINILESTRLSCDVVGVLDTDGTVYPIEQYRHKYGSASWNGEKLTLKLDKDDRLGMTFPALIFNSYNSRG